MRCGARHDDAAGSLEDLARSNAFVVSLDDHREWYRYHHLFSDLLRAELNRRHPELLPVYLAGQQIGASGTDRLARRLPTRMRPAISLTPAESRLRIGTSSQAAGRSRRLRLWLDRCTEEEIESDPQLSIAAAWVFGYLGDAARARRFLAAAERTPLDSASADGAASLRSALANLRSAMAPDGIPQMLRDAELGYAAEKKMGTPWLLGARRAMGAAYALLGRPQEAIAVLRESLALSSRPTRAQPTLGSSRSAIWSSRPPSWAIGETRNDGRSKRAGWPPSNTSHDTIYGAIAYTAGALAHNQRGDQTEAARQLENVRRLRPLLRTGPWLNADLALRCADISLDLGDVTGALELAQVAGDALQGYPDAGTLPARLQRLEARIRRGQDYGLTPAELRLVAFLRTHLSLQEIADRLHLARPTVKTHVASIYDKLGVTGRSEAVEIIEQAGLESTEAKVTVPGPDRDWGGDAASPLADGSAVRWGSAERRSARHASPAGRYPGRGRLRATRRKSLVLCASVPLR